MKRHYDWIIETQEVPSANFTRPMESGVKVLKSPGRSMEKGDRVFNRSTGEMYIAGSINNNPPRLIK